MHMKKKEEVEAWLRKYYQLNKAFFGLLIAVVSAAFGSLVFSPGSNGHQILVQFSTLLALPLIGLGFYRMFLRCPRCNKRFCYKWWYTNVFARQCVHCKFRP